METWLAVSCFLMLSLIADWAGSVQSRDFTVQDIVYLYPSTTPYPGGFKCFTCEKAADNYDCNRWAPDIFCPRESKYCYTQHIMNATGESVLVTKRCASLEQCLNTGCRDSVNKDQKDQGTKKKSDEMVNPLRIGFLLLDKLVVGLKELLVCTSCCEGNICNLPLPQNETDAIFTTLPLSNSDRSTVQGPTVLLACLFLLWLYGT